VLIGGLGFGFTLKRVLELVGPDALVEVAELLPEVVAWNREFLGTVNGPLADDPRVRIVMADVFEILARSATGSYDAIVLDVDNGPIAMVHDSNSRLYEGRGFTAIGRALKPGGRVAFWSSHSDSGFARRLGRAGFMVEIVRAKSHERAKRARHIIFVGTRRSAGNPMIRAGKR
jgi:spermidine synthase